MKFQKDSDGNPFIDIPVSDKQKVRLTWVPGHHSQLKPPGEGVIRFQKMVDGHLHKRDPLDIPIRFFEDGTVLLAIGGALRNGRIRERQLFTSMVDRRMDEITEDKEGGDEGDD